MVKIEPNRLMYTTILKINSTSYYIFCVFAECQGALRSMATVESSLPSRLLRSKGLRSMRWKRDMNMSQPIPSMYGIFTYIYHENQPNV